LAGYLTFPSGILCGDSLRLPILSLTDDWVALEKPSHISMTEKELGLESDNTASLIQAIRQRIEEKTPSFLSLFKDGWGSVYYLEKTCGGVILLARSADSLARLKHQYGSYLWKIRFTLFTRKSPTEECVICQLPVATSALSPISFVSHRKGKKASTTFTCMGRMENLQMWTAELSYIRTLQIPLHAAESGLHLAGENRYGSESDPITRRDLPGNRRPGDERNILWKDPAYFLSDLELEDGTKIHSTPPKIFQKLAALFETK